MTVNPDQRIAVVTSSSSGIGREISLTLARNGFLTYATMRRQSMQCANDGGIQIVWKRIKGVTGSYIDMII